MRQWICWRRWKRGATTRCSRRRDRPHRLGLTTGRRRSLVLQSRNTGRDHKFFCRDSSFEKGGAVSWVGNIRPVSPETNCDLDKSGQVARDRIKESRLRLHKGVCRVRWIRPVLPAYGTRPAPRCGSRRIRRRCLWFEGRANATEPSSGTPVVMPSIHIMPQASLSPPPAQRRRGFSRADRTQLRIGSGPERHFYKSECGTNQARLVKYPSRQIR